MSLDYSKDGVKIGLLAAEEPPSHSARGQTERAKAILRLLGPLKEQKGTWFRIAEFPKNSSASSTAGRLRKQQPAYEWQSRSNGKGSVLWGRYVGGKK